MPDLDRTFRSLDLLEPPDVSASIVGRAAGPEPSLPGPSRGSRLAAILVAIAVFALAVALGVRALRTTPVDEPTPTPSPDVSDLGFAPGFTEIAELPDRQEMARAYGDGRFFVWGGQARDSSPHVADGQVLDLAAREWHEVSPSPLSPRSSAATVWTGQEFIVWGGRDGEDWPPNGLTDGAAYDPVSDRWRSIPDAPIAPPSPPEAVVWTGTEMIVWGDWLGEDDPLGAAYDPASDTWRVLPAAPVRFNDVSSVWTGTEMVVFGARLGSGNRPQTPATGAAYDPVSDTWRMLPDTELSPNSTEIAWDGERLVAMDYDHDAFALDAGTWVRIGRLPANQCEGGLTTPATVDGTIVVQSCGELVALDAGSDRWRVLKGWTEPGPTLSYGDSFGADGVTLIEGGENGADVLLAYRATEPGRERLAWDIAALYGAARSGYPYAPNELPFGAEETVDGLLSAEAKARYDDASTGLPPLWTYYYGFQVLGVERVDGDLEGYRVELLLERDRNAHEILTIGPGTSVDGVDRPFVILDVQPVVPYVVEGDGVRTMVIGYAADPWMFRPSELGPADVVRCDEASVTVPPNGSADSTAPGVDGDLVVETSAEGRVTAWCQGP